MSAKKATGAKETGEAVAAEETAAEVVATETVEKKAEQKVTQDLMYLGPTITGVVRHSTVFKGGVLTAKAQDCVDKFPIMGKLFVPIGDMPEAVKEIRKGQSVLHTVYAQVADKFV